ncbi:hypothetical protein A2U01_0065487, partial [Trifolium medium]|nr:hypothetical protein [Trifolium medium]
CKECKKEEGPVDVELRCQQLIEVANKAQELLSKNIEQYRLCYEVVTQLKTPSVMEGLITRIVHFSMVETDRVHTAVLSQGEVIKKLERQVEQLTNMIVTLTTRVPDQSAN